LICNAGKEGFVHTSTLFAHMLLPNLSRMIFISSDEEGHQISA
jgi:hypothetical protein